MYQINRTINLKFTCDFKLLSRIIPLINLHPAYHIYRPFSQNKIIPNNLRPFSPNQINYTMPPVELTPSQTIKKLIDINRVMVFSKSYCPYCHRVENLFKQKGIPFQQYDLDLIENGSQIQDALAELTGQKTVPNVFINGKHIGGSDKVMQLNDAGQLKRLLDNSPEEPGPPLATLELDSAGGNGKTKDHKFQYDLVVIGGGSGGMSTSKESARQGAKVAVFDFIVPTPIGTTWGLGGTCVNVGCVPKKLMHRASLLNDMISDSTKYGWSYPGDSDQLTPADHQLFDRDGRPRDTKVEGGAQVEFAAPRRVNSWSRLVKAVQDHVHSLNYRYSTALEKLSIEYYNACAHFLDPHTIEAKDKDGKVTKVTSKYFVVASGLRPHYPPDLPEAKEHCITSDDIFSLSYPPGKTLCIGASYIALECAGFLSGVGFDLTVMVRSEILRRFDREMADGVGKYMAEHGVKFINQAVPTKIEKLEDGKPGKLRVHYKMKDGSTSHQDFNTVLLAIGREARTETLGLEKIGVKTNPKNHKLITTNEQTSVPNIYAVGDNDDGKPELTPVAVAAGNLLARRLFGKSDIQCDYEAVPTTIFTPVEYGSCGLSEENARAKYGDSDIDVYATHFRPLEWTIPNREMDVCYGKLIVVKSLKEKIVGFHYLGPNAGEITQGYAVAIKMGATKADFDRTMAIHPTQAETFIGLTSKKEQKK